MTVERPYHWLQDVQNSLGMPKDLILTDMDKNYHTKSETNRDFYTDYNLSDDTTTHTHTTLTLTQNCQILTVYCMIMDVQTQT